MNEQRTVTSRQRNIDILRGLSILAVLAYHYQWFQPISNYGLYGVLLFFLISGYCMEISLRASASALEFFLRRQSRLVPALITCAIITHLLETSFPHIKPDRLQTWSDVIKSVICIPTVDLPCGIANRIGERLGSYTMVDGAYWTLRVEFGFYALLLLLHFFVTKRFHVVGILAVSIAGAVWLHVFGGTTHVRDSIPYLPYFATGAAIFEIRNGNARYGWATLAASALIFFAFLATGIVPFSMPPNAWAYVLCTLALLTIATAPELTESFVAVPAKGVLFFGTISYPLYLLHQDIGYVLLGELGGAPFLQVVIVPVALTLLAYVVHLAVEHRLERRVKARLKSGDAGPRASEAGMMVVKGDA